MDGVCNRLLPDGFFLSISSVSERRRICPNTAWSIRSYKLCIMFSVSLFSQSVHLKISVCFCCFYCLQVVSLVWRLPEGMRFKINLLRSHCHWNKGWAIFALLPIPLYETKSEAYIPCMHAWLHASSRKCENLGLCSLGRVKPFLGDIYDSEWPYSFRILIKLFIQ